MMKVMICIAGLPAVGKTSVARALNALLSPRATHMDIDDIKREVIDSKDLTRDIDPDDIREQYYESMIQRAIAFFDECDYVIAEEVFHRHYLRNHITRKCSHHGIDVRWVHVLCSEEVVKRRIKIEPRKGHILTTEQTLSFYRKFSDLFDDFSESENALSLNSENGDAFFMAEMVISALIPEMKASDVINM